MPFESKKQAAYMFGVAGGSIPGNRKMARKFVSDSRGQKMRDLPVRVTPKRTSMRRGGR